MVPTILTRLQIKRFKLFGNVDLELGERTILSGPNSAGKTSALQALMLWHLGVKRWLEKRGPGKVSRKKSGVTINRYDVVATPVPTANMLWRNRSVTIGTCQDGKLGTRPLHIEIGVEGISNGHAWKSCMEFGYANEESFYCRPVTIENDEYMEVPECLGGLKISLLPPMSGIVMNEPYIDDGAINVRLGEGRTSEVLRNLCYRVFTNLDGPTAWPDLCEKINSIFGCQLDEPQYAMRRGEITMTYKTTHDARLDLACAGSSMLQTLLLLTHMATNPKAILLLDEPQAHIDTLYHRHIYRLVTTTAEESDQQVIMASNSHSFISENVDYHDVVFSALSRFVLNFE